MSLIWIHLYYDFSADLLKARTFDQFLAPIQPGSALLTVPSAKDWYETIALVVKF